MLCKICNKNQATIHIQEIVNGEKKTLHICAECAAKKSKDDPVLQGFNLAEMLYSLSGQIEGGPLGKAELQKGQLEVASAGQPQFVCEKCGWETGKFRKTGRLGCAECYKVFSEILSPALSNMHRGVLHVGKIPGHGSDGSGGRAMELLKLQRELEELVRHEEFEKAAGLRDRINSLRLEFRRGASQKKEGGK